MFVELLFRGVGGDVVTKSDEFTLVSWQPLNFRRTEVVFVTEVGELAGPGAGPAPSKQFAVLPYPTRSTTLAKDVGHPTPAEFVRAVVELAKATFAAVADKLIVVVGIESGVGSAAPVAPGFVSLTR